nr:terminase gpA endonuclease subunit [Methylobacterium sp. Leaf112]
MYPILTESPELAHLIRADSRSGIQDAWMDRILTTGACASIQLRGVSTNGSMRGIKGLFIGVDEASSAEYQAGTKGEKGEGSKLALIIKRAQEFFDPCVYVGGTPTVVGSCITSEEYEKGDQCLFMMRSRCCPDLAQEFWDDIQQVDDRGARLGKGMRYTCDEVTGRIADVWYECAGCGSAIEVTGKVAMMETGVLVPQNADRAEPDHASVWAWAAYSTDLQSTWMHIARDHLAQVKDPAQRQPFMNLTRARPWKPDGPGTIDANVLADRCEPYPAGHMPEGVTGVYAGMDTQEGGRNGKPRHEIVFVGYGEGEECWVLDRVVIDGIPGVDRDGRPIQEDLEPFSPDAARAVWAALDREWVTADGEILHPEAEAVDVGYDMNARWPSATTRRAGSGRSSR